MTAEQLAELKAAWSGEWRRRILAYRGSEPIYSGHELNIAPCHTVAAFVSRDGRPVVWTEGEWRESIRSDRNATTFAEAVASFRAEARKVAEQYLALCGDAP